MKTFEEGKRYEVAGGGEILIEKRTHCFITFSGDFTGRKKVALFGDKGLFGLGENIWIKKSVGSGFVIDVLCCAGYEV